MVEVLGHRLKLSLSLSVPFGVTSVVFCFCRSVGKRIRSAVLWVSVTAIVCGLVLGILYGESWALNFSLLIDSLALLIVFLALCVERLSLGS